ncbi:MBL fold metallo-hydrolase [Dyadobacter arcticus]|uniref:Ribonuclease BN (tRNA processing enzyme) n=1 Tax=Dyadobacter arcticus TaxID=1078754 RepID=A0ABX0USZ3_9BACT|nr:MBL fold metallo-hydrolase [Dyadobacter arcticus]NIJ54800.1 ribonuclease BN (tRNA processing enzyme) [Dyadobacter arcticus]
MSDSRREFIRKSLLLSGAAGLDVPSVLKEKSPVAPDGDRLVLLGTQGGPFIRSYKQSPSANLIVYKNAPIVIDAGYGVTFKLRDAGVNLSALKYIFITHHHSDHNLELGTLLYNAWIAGLKEPIHVYAPVGVKHLLHHYWESNSFDIDIRIKDEGRADIRTLVVSHEIAEGTLITNADMEVSALKNIHPPITESFAFKFKLGEKRVVFSGDTAYCEPLVSFASGADYLVHEVMNGKAVEEMVKRRPNASKLKASILSHHTLAEDVGKIAQEAKVKNLVLNHFVPPDDQTLTDQVWIDSVRSTFPGNIIVGKDLMQLGL